MLTKPYDTRFEKNRQKSRQILEKQLPPPEPGHQWVYKGFQYNNVPRGIRDALQPAPTRIAYHWVTSEGKLGDVSYTNGGGIHVQNVFAGGGHSLYWEEEAIPEPTGVTVKNYEF